MFVDVVSGSGPLAGSAYQQDALDRGSQGDQFAANGTIGTGGNVTGDGRSSRAANYTGKVGVETATGYEAFGSGEDRSTATD